LGLQLTDHLSFKKFLNWLLFNVFFALLPLISVWFFRSLAGQSTVSTLNDFPEILFFSLMVCATTVGDLRGLEKPARWNRTFLVLESALLLGAIGSAILYGGLRFAGIIRPDVSFHATLLSYSLALTVLLFLLSLTSEILIAYVDIKPKERTE
jgi:hypothetical protein